MACQGASVVARVSGAAKLVRASLFNDLKMMLKAPAFNKNLFVMIEIHYAEPAPFLARYGNYLIPVRVRDRRAAGLCPDAQLIRGDGILGGAAAMEFCLRAARSRKLGDQASALAEIGWPQCFYRPSKSHPASASPFLRRCGFD